jgi:hypothetical protein
VAYTKKIKAGLVPIGIDQFVGDEGTIFYDPAVGDLHLSDGVTPGGTLLSSSGGNGNGYTGSQGTNGYTGSTGLVGYTGSTGTNGSNGVTGYTGSIGESGNASLGNWAFRNDTIYNMAGGEINNGDTTHDATAGLILPENGDAGAISALFNTYGSAQIQVANIVNSATTSVWSFSTDGTTTLPGAVKSQSVARVGQIITCVGLNNIPGQTFLFNTVTFTGGVYSDIQVGWTVSNGEGWTATVTAIDDPAPGYITIDVNWDTVSDKLISFTSADYQVATSEDLILTSNNSSLTLSSNGNLTLPNSGGVIKSTASSTIINGAYKSFTFSTGAYGVGPGYAGTAVTLTVTPESQQIQVGWTCTFSNSATVFNVVFVGYDGAGDITVGINGVSDNLVFPMIARSPTSSIKLQPVSGGSTWTFSGDGTTTLPGNLSYPYSALQRDTALAMCPGNASTVVYIASADIQHTIKLLIQVEGLVGAETLPDTQSCEMIIAKSFRGNNIASTVYAIVHTSAAPLATFTALWDGTINRVEVICTPTGANAVDVKTFATEITAVVT